MYRAKVADLNTKLNTILYRANLAEHYGTHIDTINVINAEKLIVRTATKCKHIVVVQAVENEDKLKVYAVSVKP